MAEPDATPRRSRARWILPPAASIAVHAGLLIALTAVTIEVARDRPEPRPQRVTLAAPATPGPAGQSAQAQPAPGPGQGEPAPLAITEPAAITEALAGHATTGRGAARAAAPTQLAPAPVTDAILAPANAASPSVRFAEIDAAPARTVVFVVDASGAVASAFTFVREELLRAIDQLSPTQRFQVIVFPGPENSPPVTAPINRGRLALATPAAKRAVAEWMATFRPRGQSKPLAGLKDALALQPDIVMLITRSIERTGPDAAWGDGLHETLAELDALNPTDRTGRRRSAIAAVQLLDEDPTGIMPAIAARHGQGVSDYRVVTADNLASIQPRLPRAAGAARTHTIDAAAAILAELDDTGVTLRLFHGLPDAADRARADEQAARAANLAARTPDDARARVLLARAQTLTADRAALDAAIHTLTEELLHDADADAWRRLALVDALTLIERFDDARDELAALQADALELPVSRPTRARIATTAAALGREPTDPDDTLQRSPFTDDTGTTDPYWTLALTEALARGRLRHHASDPYAPLLRLLDRAERERADAWPPILTDRIARAADLRPPSADHAPARARLIIATHWSRSPATRADARRLLETLTESAPPHPHTPHRPEALWRLALLERSEDTPASRARAADLFATLAADHPDDPNAPDALAGAIALTTDENALLALLHRATQSLPDRPEIDLWRLRLAELLAGPARLDALEPIAPGTRESTLARALYAETAEPLHASVEPDAQRALAVRTAAYLARHDSPDAPRWLTRAAEALTDAEPVRAIELAEQSIARARALAQPTARAELALARAQLRARRTDNALRTLTPLAARLVVQTDVQTEVQADEQSDAAHFWEAWTLLLETAGPQDPPAARAHLARLELLDPNLGGHPWSDRLRTLRTQLSTP
ncbi:MAG: hypothetical protein LAT64_13660 [Phycisphaerales bacterium]|nr:hypothetical protein [Planctomycetota bacterium]MCH8509800.1 hypothetical protein [Phycisphaerales bacterium]